MEVDPQRAVVTNVRLMLANAERARASGVICLVRGKWLTVHVNLTVLHDGMPDPHHVELERDGVCAFDMLLQEPELAQLLAGLEVGGARLPPGCREAAVPGTAHSPRPRFLPRTFAMRDWRIDWPCNEVTVQGGGYECDTLQERFLRFMEALPTMDPPIDDKMALCRELGIVGDLDVSRGGHLYVYRPLPVRFHRVGNTPTLNEIEVSVEAHGPSADTFSVGVMPGTGRRSARRLHARDFESVPGKPSLRTTRVRLPEPGPVKASLSVRDGEVADEIETGLPWAPILIHEQLDPGCELLQSLLFGPSGRGQTEPREFERGVTWLLHLCGCAAMHLGRSKREKDLQGSADIVATTPAGDCLIGECSLKGPPDEKLGKLLERAGSVERMLQRAGAPRAVRVVFFVGEEFDGEAEGVEFVDLAQLKGMFERLRAGRPDGLCWW